MEYNVDSILIKNNLSLDEFNNIFKESTFFDVIRNKIGFGNTNRVIYLYI
jgi:ABC-type polysaccharide transport system permease subunit